MKKATKQILASKVRARKTRVARHALSHAVLIGLTLTAGMALITVPGLREVFKLLPKEKRSPQAVSQAIERLYRQGLVALTGTHGARKAMLTDKGKRMAFLRSLQLQPVHSKKWDGMWYLVSFDIPIEKLGARNALRRKLKQLGFLEYQKSLYIYPHGCESELDFLVEYFNVSQHVKRFYAADLSDENELRKKFRL